MRYHFHFISEGKQSDFGSLCDIPGQWHLNTCAIEAFDRLVRADILVTAKSSFSYVAALLNPNIIVYESFWHKPMTHWNVIADDGTLSPGATEKIRSAAKKQRQVIGSYNH